MTIRTALLSVSDKTGIVELAQALVARGISILSTGGTARLLADAGLTITEVAEHTGSPEILDGRVKTLHPRIHAGLLARRDQPEHLQTLEDQNITAIDLLVVNLYPFEATISHPNCPLTDAVENIDIGGPAMLRAAAKNHGTSAGGVTAVVDPADYPRVISELDSHQGSTSYALRLELATKAYAHTAAYDGAIANYLSSLSEPEPHPNHAPARDRWPAILTVQLNRQERLRYGENPHQEAAFYIEPSAGDGLLSTYQQYQGKALSYNNIADADAAWECVRQFNQPGCVIVKHANPCGVAVSDTPKDAYLQAFKTDATSAFGGIIAFNRAVDAAVAEALSQQFVEVLLAPSYTPEALALLANKKNIRVLEIPAGSATNAMDIKRVGGGWLVQDTDHHALTADQLQVVTTVQPTAQQRDDMLFAWQVAQYVKSNAIVFASQHATLGIGAGQMSRLDSARIAATKAGHAQLDLTGSVVASDAFFPFRDGLDVVADAGATAVIQPGGSIRDDEVIAAANERGLTMVFTGVRHFRH